MGETMDTPQTGSRGFPEPFPCRELKLVETCDFKNFALLFLIQFHMLKELQSEEKHKLPGLYLHRRTSDDYTMVLGNR